MLEQANSTSSGCLPSGLGGPFLCIFFANQPVLSAEQGHDGVRSSVCVHVSCHLVLLLKAGHKYSSKLRATGRDYWQRFYSRECWRWRNELSRKMLMTCKERKLLFILVPWELSCNKKIGFNKGGNEQHQFSVLLCTCHWAVITPHGWMCEYTSSTQPAPSMFIWQEASQHPVIVPLLVVVWRIDKLWTESKLIPKAKISKYFLFLLCILIKLHECRNYVCVYRSSLEFTPHYW